jgi:hypothetical protein
VCFFRHPEKKLNKVIALFSSEGAGKGVFLKTLFALLGDHNCVAVQGTKHITTFNSYLEGKIILYLDEAPPNAFQQNELCMVILIYFLQIKAIASEDTLRIEQKYCPERETQNFINVFISSNYKTTEFPFIMNSTGLYPPIYIIFL